MTSLPDLVCPAGSLPALKAAIDNGADAVYLGFRNATNARNVLFRDVTMAGTDFSGANLSGAVMRDVVGTGAIFTNANITRLLLTDTDLTGATWMGTDPGTSIINAGGNTL